MSFENKENKGFSPKTKQEATQLGERKYKRIEKDLKKIIDQFRDGTLTQGKASKIVNDLLEKELNLSPVLEYSMFNELLAMRNRKEITDEEFERYTGEFLESLPDEKYPKRKM